ncbi:MAG: hypothetical protein LBG71_07620 [Clostridiales Family XIII bacterium]|nr:hypothetical protein [Clostridiales Family XIII bacterium]
MMKMSCHYLAQHEDIDKLISQIKRREKEAIKHRRQALTSLINMNKLQGIPLPRDITMDDFMEQVVVVSRYNVISTYASITTEFQELQNTWIKFDTRPGGLAQKYAALMFGLRGRSARIEVCQKGEVIEKCEYELDSRLPIDSGLYFQDLGCSEIRHAWISALSRQCLSESALNIPLLLPADWDSAYLIRQKTQYATFCEIIESN